MKQGDLVIDPFTKLTGIIMRVDKEYYGARQAIKCYGATRGVAINSRSGNGIGPTARGIRDRLLVLWNEIGYGYCESDKVTLLSET